MMLHMRRMTVVAVLGLALANPAGVPGQTAAPRGPFADARVEHAGIVVADVDRAARAYAELFGIDPVAPADFRGIAYPPDFRGDREAHPRYAMLRLTGASLELLQPVGGASPWREHLEQYGDSLHHICFGVRDVAVAAAHLQSLGGQLELGGGPDSTYAYVNFREPLGFTIELSRLRPAMTAADTSSGVVQSTLGLSPIRHIGMIVKSVDTAAALFGRILDVPVPPARPPSVIVFPPDFQGDRNARNRNVTFPMNVNIEIVEPVGGKSMWRDEVDAHGSSIHHLGIGVAPSMASWIDYLRAQHGRLVTGPGTGYAFVDLRPGYALTLELNGK